MENQEIQTLLEQEFEGSGLEFSEYGPRLICRVPREKTLEVTEFCRDNSDLNMNYLSDVTAIDYLHLGITPRFDVVYQLYSVGKYHHLRIKCGVPENDNVISSVSSIWPSAEKPECEIFDLYGIQFENHPDLYRLIMPEDWEGTPLAQRFSAGWLDKFLLQA